MESTDSRLQAMSPQSDRAPVTSDMLAADVDGASAVPLPPGESLELPLDAVPGFEPSAELPLTAPAVNPPLGAISRLEEALSNFAPLPPLESPVAAPADVSAPARAPQPLSAPAQTLADPTTPAVSPPMPPPSPTTPSAATPIAAPSVDPLQPGVTPVPPPAAQPEIRVNPPQDALSLPGQPRPPGEAEATAVPAAPVGAGQPTRLPMLPIRVVAVGSTAAALTLSAWQAARVIDEQDRLASLSLLSLLFALVGAAGVILWTWAVTENARRLLSPARTLELPDPARAAMTWIVPMVFIAGSSAAVTYLSVRLNNPSEGTESSFPLLLALAAIVLSLPLMYSPVTYVSGVVRKVGGRGIRFAEWIWVPVVLSIVGAAMIAGLRVGGAFGDDFDGLAPAWVIGVAAIVPATVVVALGWRAAAAVEADVGRAFDRRLGVRTAPSTRRSRAVSLSASGGPNHTALRQHGYINQLPGTQVLGVAISAVLAGLALLSLVAAIVVFLFWQETRDGLLLPEQSDRAWDLVSLLHSLERNVAFVLLVLIALWSFIAITNIRFASMRRRNPILAAAAWPLAAAGVWVVGDRLVADGSAIEVIVGFATQALILAVPVFLLYRGAGSIGARRQGLRITWAVGVVLLVHVQGLGGLSTADASLDSTQVARLAGYLAIGAFLQLLAMFAAAGAMRALADTTRQVTMRHNALVAKGQPAEVAQPGSVEAPRVTNFEVSEATDQ